jgi:hypothetical protein
MILIFGDEHIQDHFRSTKVFGITKEDQSLVRHSTMNWVQSWGLQPGTTAKQTFWSRELQDFLLSTFQLAKKSWRAPHKVES